MNQAQLAQVLKAIDTFDRATQAMRGCLDCGQGRCVRSKRLYKAAKARLVNMLKDITVEDMASPTPASGSIVHVLTQDEKDALREVVQQVNGGLPKDE